MLDSLLQILPSLVGLAATVFGIRMVIRALR